MIQYVIEGASGFISFTDIQAISANRLDPDQTPSASGSVLFAKVSFIGYHALMCNPL